MKDMFISLVPAVTQPALPKRMEPVAESGSNRPVSQLETGKDVPVRDMPEVPEVDLSGVVESLNDYLQSVRRDLRFSMDDATGRTVITVLHADSQEVIRQIPPESVQALAAYLRAQGVIDSVGVVEKA